MTAVLTTVWIGGVAGIVALWPVVVSIVQRGGGSR